MKTTLQIAWGFCMILICVVLLTGCGPSEQTALVIDVYQRNGWGGATSWYTTIEWQAGQARETRNGKLGEPGELIILKRF